MSNAPKGFWQSYPSISCVYFVVDGEECVYIGKTSDLRQRLTVNPRLRADIRSGRFRVYWWHMSNQVARGIEAQFICHFKPRLNKSFPHGVPWG